MYKHHKKHEHGEGVYVGFDAVLPCEKCGQVFLTKLTLTAHKRNTHELRKAECRQ